MEGNINFIDYYMKLVGLEPPGEGIAIFLKVFCLFYDKIREQ